MPSWYIGGCPPLLGIPISKIVHPRLRPHKAHNVVTTVIGNTTRPPGRDPLSLPSPARPACPQSEERHWVRSRGPLPPAKGWEVQSGHGGGTACSWAPKKASPVPKLQACCCSLCPSKNLSFKYCIQSGHGGGTAGSYVPIPPVPKLQACCCVPCARQRICHSNTVFSRVTAEGLQVAMYQFLPFRSCRRAAVFPAPVKESVIQILYSVGSRRRDCR